MLCSGQTKMLFEIKSCYTSKINGQNLKLAKKATNFLLLGFLFISQDNLAKNYAAIKF